VLKVSLNDIQSICGWICIYLAWTRNGSVTVCRVYRMRCPRRTSLWSTKHRARVMIPRYSRTRVGRDAPVWAACAHAPCRRVVLAWRRQNMGCWSAATRSRLLPQPRVALRRRFLTVVSRNDILSPVSCENWQPCRNWRFFLFRLPIYSYLFPVKTSMVKKYRLLY